MKKLPQKIRKWCNAVVNYTLIAETITEDSVDDLTEVLKIVIEGAESMAARDIARMAYHALLGWKELGNSVRDFNPKQSQFGLHDRSEFYAYMNALDAVLDELGYPSWRAIRDEWSDTVEEG